MTDGPVWATFDVFRHGTGFVVVSRVVEKGILNSGEQSPHLKDLPTVKEYIALCVLGWPRIVPGK